MSGFDPTQALPACVPGQAGMRNQNIYTTRITQRSGRRRARQRPAARRHSAQLSGLRAEQQHDGTRSYRFAITNQPRGRTGVVQAVRSAHHARRAGAGEIDGRPHGVRAVEGSATRRSPSRVTQITRTGRQTGAERTAGHDHPESRSDQSGHREPGHRRTRTSRIPDIENRLEVYNPDIENAIDAQSGHREPRHREPRHREPGHREHDASPIPTSSIPTSKTRTSRTRTSRIPTSRIPTSRTPTWSTARSATRRGPSRTTGNAAGAFTVRLALNQPMPRGVQEPADRAQDLPDARRCSAATLLKQPQTVLLANVPNPRFVAASELANPDIENPDIENVTIALAPGETARITLRVLRSESHRHRDVQRGRRRGRRRRSRRPSTRLRPTGHHAAGRGGRAHRRQAPVPGSTVGGAYSTTLTSIGTGTWSVAGGTCPRA